MYNKDNPYIVIRKKNWTCYIFK